MAYQFIHIETYSEARTKVKDAKGHFNSAAQVLGEAMRVPEYSAHVETPGKIYCLGGTMSVAQLQAKRAGILVGLKETVTLKNGKTYERKLRHTAATLYTEIHSHPLSAAEFLADPNKHHPEIKKWYELALADFEERMPAGVDWTAVMHLDESHVHFHILSINSNDAKLDANKLHAGKAAAARLRAGLDKPTAVSSLPKPELEKRPRKPKQPRPSKNRETQRKNKLKREAQLAAWDEACKEVEARNAAVMADWTKSNGEHLSAARKERGKIPEKDTYNAAMKALQDRYYEHVGKPCGLLRDGPRGERLSTVEYASRKTAAKKMAADCELIEKGRNRVDHEIDMVEDIKASHAQAFGDLSRKQAQFDEGLEAMETLVTQLETGDATISAGAIQMQNPPSFLKRLFKPDTDETQTIGIFRRLLKLIVQGVEGEKGANEKSLRSKSPEL
ncbi:MAG: Mob protein [Paracoccaceae bacterium]